MGDYANDRVEEFSSAGALITEFGSAGSGEGDLLGPTGIAIDSGGNVWVADNGNNRVEEFSSSGAYKAAYGKKGASKGEFNSPYGIAFSGGNLYVADGANNRVQELSPSGVYLGQFGVEGTGNGQFKSPRGISTDPNNGDLYVTDIGNYRVEEFTASGTYLTQFGTQGSGNGQFSAPADITANSSGDLYIVDTGGNERIQEWEPVPSFPAYTTQIGTPGSGNGQLKEPKGVAMAKDGNLFVLDSSNGRVQEFSLSGKYEAKFGSGGTGAGQVKGPYGMTVDSKGDVWIADTANDRVDEFSEKGVFVQAFGWGVNKGGAELEVCTTSCKAGIVGAGGGEFDEPKDIVVAPNGTVYVSDNVNNRIQVFTEKGEFIAVFGWGVTNEKAEFEVCTKASECKIGKTGGGAGEMNGPIGVALDANGNLWVADRSNNRVDEFNEKHELLQAFGWGVNKGGAELEVCTNATSCKAGTAGAGSGQFKEPKGIAIDSSSNVWVSDTMNNRVQEFTTAGGFLTSFGDKGTGNGQFEEPWGIAFAPSGAAYIADNKNNRVQEWTPAPRPGNEGAHDTKTIYYSAAANAEYPNCGNHPEWANLLCQIEPDVQPGDSGPPALPVTTTTYNMWEQSETITEKIGLVTRTTKKKYDSAGRETSNEEIATFLKEGKEEEDKEDKALAAVTDEYSSETGAMVKLTSTIESKARTITSVYNTLGQLTSYTDAEGSTTKYVYDIDRRMQEVSEPKGHQTYEYDATTGFLKKLVDSAGGTFTATYGVAGEMLTEGYPNGMTAKYTYNPVGQTTNLEYEKTTNCKEKCVWFSDAEAFGPQGELATQTSTLSSENYSYNEEGQLSQTQETPVGGKGCITRLYGYNESTGKRTSLATREPNEKGECAAEGGVVEGHAYDVVGRLLDPGVVYDALGNMTKVPALDAGGSPITSSFYADNQAATQEQSEKKLAYSYDPAGRTMIAKLNGKSKTISHYAGPGQALTWTCEEEEGKNECEEAKETKWTRNILGIDGALDAIQTNGGVPVLQLHDLQGNVVATAADNETETKLLSTQNSTEFGVSPTGKTAKFSWLGATGAESELETGVITSAGATYVPQLASTIATEPVIPPGAAPNGVMATEAYCPPELPWANQSGNEGAANAVAQQRAKEREAEEALYAGSSNDPWGLLTGKEAKEFAGEFREWAIAVENYKEHGCPNAICVEAAKADISADWKMVEKLEECSRQAHEPSYRKYNGKTYMSTHTCLVHLNWGTNFLNWVSVKQGTGVWIGESLPFHGSEPSPWGNHGPNEWYFENVGEISGDNQWWVFGSSRGWWKKIL